MQRGVAKAQTTTITANNGKRDFESPIPESSNIAKARKLEAWRKSHMKTIAKVCRDDGFDPLLPIQDC